MHKKGCLFFICGMVSQTTFSESVLRVHNNTIDTVYATTYDYSKGSWKRAQSIFSINPLDQIVMPKSPRKLFHEQRLVVALNQSDLADTIKVKSIKGVLPSYNVALVANKKRNTDLSVQTKKDALVVKQGSGIVEHLSKLGFVVGDHIKKQISPFSDASYSEVEAKVRQGNELSSQEQACLKKRTAHIRQHIALALGLKDEDIAKIPRIGMIFSGGGIRAMVSTFGWLVGAEKTGLLDLVSYIGALSGSTWAVGTWLSYKSHPSFASKSISEIQSRVFEKIIKDIHAISNEEMRAMAKPLLSRIAYDQPISAVDIFGHLLTNHLLEDFGQSKYDLYLYQQYPLIETGSVPFPIYTAVEGATDAIRFPENVLLFNLEAANKPWVEYSPVEVGTTSYSGAYVPTWAFGRSFYQGVSTNNAPGVTVGKMMATCGSAYASSIGMIWQKVKDGITNPFIREYLKKIVAQEKAFLEQHGSKSVPYTRAEEFNFMYGLPADLFKKRSTQNVLKLKDAGLSFNLPYPPLSGERCSERKMDILIVCDASASLAEESTKEFGYLISYAEAAGLPFPKISLDAYPDLSKKAMTVFEDSSNPDAPIVIYLPMCRDAERMQRPEMLGLEYASLKTFNPAFCIKKVCSTFNFKWPVAVSKSLSKLMEYNLVSNIDTIKSVIKKKVIAKK